MGRKEYLLRQLLAVRETPGLLETYGKHESPILAHEVTESGAIPSLHPGNKVPWLHHFTLIHDFGHHQYSGAGGPKSWVGIRDSDAASIQYRARL